MIISSSAGLLNAALNCCARVIFWSALVMSRIWSASFSAIIGRSELLGNFLTNSAAAVALPVASGAASNAWAIFCSSGDTFGCAATEALPSVRLTIIPAATLKKTDRLFMIDTLGNFKIGESREHIASRGMCSASEGSRLLCQQPDRQERNLRN